MHENRLKDEEGRLAALRRYEIRDNGSSAPLQRIVDLVQDVLKVPMAAVCLVDADRQVVRASRGFSVVDLPREQSFAHHAIQAGEALVVPDATQDGRFSANPLVTADPHIRAYAGVPLRTPDGYNVGALCALDTSPREFTEREVKVLASLAEIVVEQFEMQQVARQDAMTGALTRSGFFAELEKEFQRATRYDRPSALVVIDVDHFRDINDRYGHPAGDEVLIAIANACMSSMRKSDLFGRVGGEEFALLLPETSPEEARDAGERIRRMVESTIVETPRHAVRATVSLGIAPIPAAAEGSETWFNEADIAVYEAKQFGRNRVVVAKARRPASPPATAAEVQHLH